MVTFAKPSCDNAHSGLANVNIRKRIIDFNQEDDVLFSMNGGPGIDYRMESNIQFEK